MTYSMSFKSPGRIFACAGPVDPSPFAHPPETSGGHFSRDEFHSLTLSGPDGSFKCEVLYRSQEGYISYPFNSSRLSAPRPPNTFDRSRAIAPPPQMSGGLFGDSNQQTSGGLFGNSTQRLFGDSGQQTSGGFGGNRSLPRRAPPSVFAHEPSLRGCHSREHNNSSCIHQLHLRDPVSLRELQVSAFARGYRQHLLADQCMPAPKGLEASIIVPTNSFQGYTKELRRLVELAERMESSRQQDDVGGSNSNFEEILMGQLRIGM